MFARKRVYAALSGRLSKAFRFPLVRCADELQLTCWCVPIAYDCMALGNDLLRGQGTLLLSFFSLKTFSHEV